MLRFPCHLFGLTAPAVSLMVAVACAQPPGAGADVPGERVGFSDGFMAAGILPGLLANSQVQDDLKLTDVQKKNLREYSQKLREELRERFGRREDGQDSSEEQRRERFRKIREEMAVVAAEVEKKVAEILEPAQFGRFKEIELQLQGVQGLGRPDIAQALGLSNQQKQDLQQVIAEIRDKLAQFRKQSIGFRQGGRDLSDEERAKRRQQAEQLRREQEEIRKDAQKEAVAILTDEQKAKYSGLKGKPFEFRRPEGDRDGFGGRPRVDGRRGPRAEQ